MSLCLTLSEDKLDEVLNIIPRFEAKIASAESIFKIEGKRLEEVARTLPEYQASYQMSFNELKAVESWLDVFKDKLFARLWKKYNEGYSRSLSPTDIKAYIGGDKEMVELEQIKIEITVLKNNFDSIVDSLKQMGWQLGSITKLRIAELEETIL